VNDCHRAASGEAAPRGAGTSAKTQSSTYVGLRSIKIRNSRSTTQRPYTVSHLIGRRVLSADASSPQPGPLRNTQRRSLRNRVRLG